MKLIFTLFVLILFVYNLSAQPGSLDKSFGEQGVFLDTSFWADCRALTIQPDGKILAGGYTQDLERPFSNGGFYIARYNSNGSIDESFGENGKFIVRKIPGAQPLSAKTIVVLPDGKILACGYFIIGSLFSHPGLVRLFSDGRIDSSFGTNGFVITKLSEWSDAIAGMAVQPDGKIVVAGNKQSAEYQSGPEFVLRYLPDGKPDESFGDNGQIFTYFSSNVKPGAVLLQPDGKIVTGNVYGASTAQFQLARYNSNGTIDEGFGTNGIARIRPVSGFLSQLNSLAMQDDGKLIAAGRYDAFEPAMAIARFNANGTADFAFGNLTLGYTYFYTPNVYAIGQSIFLTKENRIIMTGFYSTADPAKQVAAVQFNNNGMIDSSFGEYGVAAGGFPEKEYGSDIISGIGLLQPDGKIIVSGSFTEADGIDLNKYVGMFRFNGDESRKQILIAKIRRWLQHHNGIVWDNMLGVKSYIVQRSADGVRWTTVYHSPVTANSQLTINYYNDASPLPGTNYYRLQTTSTDGAVGYSNVIAINNEPSTISISPNPAKNVLHIEGLSASNKAEITVVDLNGNVAMRYEPSTINSSYDLNITPLKPGNYWLKLEVNGEVITKQFVKE